MKAVICAIARYEYDYIKEWVDYHLKLGFDKIVIYDNNMPNEERYDELLFDYIKQNKVEIRDVRGKTAMQRVVYNEFYHEGDFDWVAFIDIDEFISPNRNKYKNIKEFIEKRSDCDAIYLYWQTFGDSGKTYPIKNHKEVSILKQYNIPCNNNVLIDNAMKKQNSWGKSIIKAGLNVKYLHEHFIIDPNNINYVNSLGDKTFPTLYFPDDNMLQQTYKECYIKHLYTKSLYEYIDCKVRRPAANNKGGIMHFPSKYFKVNDITEEKRKYLESIGYKMEFVFKPDVLLIVEVSDLDDYYKLKPYILNIINLCSTRFVCRVISSEDDANTIYDELSGVFNECSIYYSNIENKMYAFKTIYEDSWKNVVNHTNCIIHMNIPYNVDKDNYIANYINPLFNINVLKNNLISLFNNEKSLCVGYNSLVSYNENNKDEFKKFKSILNDIGVQTNLSTVAITGNFIGKTVDFLNFKNEYNMLKSQLSDPTMLLYFISNMFKDFMWFKA